MTLGNEITVGQDRKMNARGGDLGKLGRKQWKKAGIYEENGGKCINNTG